MAMAKWVILFTFLLSYSLFFIAGIDTVFTSIIGCFQDASNPMLSANSTGYLDPSRTPAASSCNLGGFNLFTDLKTILLGLAGVGLAAAVGGAAIGSITAGTIRFIDTSSIFGLASLFLFFFFTFPIGALNNAFIPIEFKILFGGYLSIAYLLTYFEFSTRASM